MSNTLIAVLKGDDKRLVITEDRDLYTVPCDLSTNSQEFNIDYNLSEEEWYAINRFSKQEYCAHIEHELSAIGYIDKDEVSRIEFCVAVQGEFLLFQRVTPSTILRKKKGVILDFFSGTHSARIIENDGMILLSSLPDAIYSKEEDILYFKDLSKLTRIFRGIDVLYKEATDEEVGKFFGLDFIMISSQFEIGKIKKRNRRKITEALDRISEFGSEEKTRLYEYAASYRISAFDQKQNKFVVSNNNDLGDLLDVVNQRYYTTEIDCVECKALAVQRLEDSQPRKD